jgi:CheY-like chemotaxis protein
LNGLEITAFNPHTGKARRLAPEDLSEILLLLADCARALARGETLEPLADRFAEIGLEPAWYETPTRKTRPLFLARRDGHERAGYTLRSLADACAAAENGTFDRWAAGSDAPPLVWIVDDDDVFREMLAHLLRAKGYAVDLFGGGKEALSHLEQLSAKPPRLIMLDMMMPELGGLETARELRRQGVTVPVVLMTARQLDEGSVAALKAGDSLAGFLAKPFQTPRLLELLGQVLASHPERA